MFSKIKLFAFLRGFNDSILFPEQSKLCMVGYVIHEGKLFIYIGGLILCLNIRLSINPVLGFMKFLPIRRKKNCMGTDGEVKNALGFHFVWIHVQSTR